MQLKDYIAKQPIDVIIKTEIEENKVILPIEIDVKEFYKAFKNEIDSDQFTPEKAIYIASIEKPKPFINSRSLLNSRLHFG